MVNRFSAAARDAVGHAVTEAARRGDARVGTEHLLLGVLHDAGSPAAAALGVDLAAARDALHDMDIEALRAVGVEASVGPLGRGGGSRHQPFTAGAKNVLRRTVAAAARQRRRRIEPQHLLLALLDCAAPDTTAQLLARLGVDPVVVRSRLADAA